MLKIVSVLFIISLFTSQLYSQTEWVKHPDPVLTRGDSGDWDNALIANPYVLFDGAGYNMWYAGNDGNPGTNIGYAYSLDGIQWEKDTINNPVLISGPTGDWDEVTVWQPCVYFDGTTYHMWFSGHNSEIRHIGYATSPDGKTWTKYDDPTTPSPPYSESDPVLTLGVPGSWDDDWVDSPEVLLIDGVFHMWYSGNDDTNHDAYTRIGHATSIDGIHWAKDTLNPVLEVGPTMWDSIMTYQPAVLYDGNNYHLWYSGGGLSFEWSIGYAYSKDGSNWIKTNSLNPVLTPGPSGSWDDTYVGLCGVIYNSDSTKAKMWYTGGTGFAIGDIGYATSDSIVISVENNILDLVPNEFVLSQNYPNPFNPTTKIKYQIPELNFVTLKVYDVLGREVASILNEEKPAGNYEITFDASSLSSGAYFYRLKAGKYAENKKMLLLK